MISEEGLKRAKEEIKEQRDKHRARGVAQWAKFIENGDPFRVSASYANSSFADGLDMALSILEEE